MSRSIARALGVLAVVALAVCLTATASAQTTQTKETVPGGQPIVTRTELKGEVIAVGSNWLIAKSPTAEYKLYAVKPERKFIIDGAPKPLSQLQPGTMLTATITTTEKPLVNRTTTITKGTVFWASPTSVIVTLENGENKQYAVPSGFKFNVEGKQLEAGELRKGMKLSATRILEEPINVISEETVVTGTAPK
jgi:hypothetical protein